MEMTLFVWILALFLQSPLFIHARAVSNNPACTITGSHTITNCFVAVQNPIAAPWSSATSTGYVAAKSTGTGAKASNDTGNSIVVYTTGSAANDQESTILYQNSTGSTLNGGVTGPCVRMDLSGNAYCWLINQGSVYVITAGSGGATPVTGCPAHFDGDVFQLQVTGTTLTCRDLTAGTSATGTDTTYTTGRVGFLVGDAADNTNQVVKFGGTQ